MTATASSRLRGGTPRAVQSDRRQRLRRVSAGVAIGLGCTTMAAAAIGAGMYAGATRNALATARSDDDAQTAQTIVAKTLPSPVAARFPSVEASFAMRDDANANPTFAFAIPEHAQRAGLQIAPRKPAPRLATVALYNEKADTGAKPPRAAVRLASLTPQDELKLAPQDDARDTRTAIYDITAQALYMPDGETFEAHSGLGGFMDNPRHVHLKMRGATPPNSYRLTMRESKFHGVEAVRMNPEDEDAMMGRAGILVHPYMLGPTGESNGCISLKEYGKFLSAFKRGEVERIVVVSRLDNPPAYAKVKPKNPWTAWLPKMFGG
jgi:hypothetical protein